MLAPKRTKYRKVQKIRSIKGNATRGTKLINGEFGLKAEEPYKITANQIEAVRVTLSRYTKKFGKVYIKIFPDVPVTIKPAGTRMGSGKGNPEYFVAIVKPERILFELAGLPEAVSREALRKAMQKLPIKCKIVSKADQKNEDEGGVADEV